MNQKFSFFKFIFPLLIFVNLVAHFLPPERMSLAPDDFITLSNVKNTSISEIVNGLKNSPDRYLGLLFSSCRMKVMGLNWEMMFGLIIISSSVLAICIYLLMFELLNNQFLALLSTVFYILLPNKLDLYHTSIYVNININYSLYALSFLWFVLFIKKEHKSYFLLSLLSYLIAIFWYEVGFCLPFILFFYALIYDRKKLFYVLLFLIPAIFYALARFTGLFGIFEVDPSGRAVQLSILGILERLFIVIPHHYVGRYMIRAIVYALYRFLTIEMPWLVIILLMDAVLLLMLIRWLRTISLPIFFDKKLIFFSIIILFSFLLPNSLYVIEPRHTGLSSIGFAILLVIIFQFIRKYRETIVVGILFIFLIVSQGTAWNQVVACRIQNAVFQTIREFKKDILQADYIIIDQYSYAKNIPYTWGEKSMNMLDCYWGMQAFAPWGFYGMLYLTDGNMQKIGKNSYVSRSIIKKEGARLIFQDYSSGLQELPIRGTLIVDYNTTYGKFGERYKNGNRTP